MSTFPEELGGSIYFRRQTFVNGTIERRLLERFAVRAISRQRNSNLRWKSNNSSRRVFRHFFLHVNGHSLQIEPELFGLHAHDRAHASTERGRDEVSRRKRFAFAFVVGRGIGRDFGLRRPMRGIAMKIAGIFDVDFDHDECGASLRLAN